LRRLIAGAFTPRSADKLRPFMREVVGGLVDAVAASGRCELVADVCEPYPIPIICELLGAPKEDWKLFSNWATDIFRIFNNDLVNRAVEESMRCLGAVRGTGRIASEDIEYRGVLFPQGTLVATSLAGANFDDGAWRDPTVFDITQERSTPQMTFGSGVHFCLG